MRQYQRHLSFGKRMAAPDARRCQGFCHGTRPISVGAETPTWCVNWYQLKTCRCGRFDPSSRDPTTCANCKHAEKQHETFDVGEAVRIKGEVLEQVKRTFGGRRYGVPQALGDRDAPRSREIKYYAPADFRSVAGLETVNIFTDPRIFAILDEGCNRTCHGKLWRENAEMKLGGVAYG